MKTCKKIIHIIIALLPVAVILIYTVSGLMSTERLDLSTFEMGTIQVEATADSYYVKYTDGTLTSIMIKPWIESNTKLQSGFMYSIVGLLYNIQNNTGLLVLNTFCFYTVILLTYLFCIEIIELLINLIMLPVRLCNRWLESCS